MGAGVIPLAIKDGELLFLFQKTFSGRKAGTLIDFGGGLNEGESYRQAAVREFVEESETLYFADHIESACRSESSVQQQIQQIDKLFECTLSEHPDWGCRRASINPNKPKDWRTYFIEFPFRELSPLNQEWSSNSQGRFKKRRQLLWISADQLLKTYAQSPDRLWKRVRQLEGAEALIHKIQASLPLGAV